MTHARHTANGARPQPRPAVAAAAVTLAAMAAALALPAPASRAARADDVTASQTALRSGWDAGEPGLSPALLRSGRFRELFRTRLDGQVYAQPLVVGQTVIAATENNWVYGVNAVTGAIRWRRHLARPFLQRGGGCGDLGPHAVVPHVGVTSTPVYDPQNGSVFLVADTGGTSPVFSLFGISAKTGRVRERIPIHGVAANDWNIHFRPIHEQQRPGLLLMNGWVYAGFGSYCDRLPYVGFVAGVKFAGGQVRLWSAEAGRARNGAGIWQSGGGLMSDGPGRIFLTTGNGVPPPRGSGTSPPQTLGDSVVRLAVSPGGWLGSRDFFSPANAPALIAWDGDFGSGGPTGLPFGAVHYPALLVQAGKDGRVFVLDRDHLGGRGQTRGGGDRALAEAGPFPGQFGHPAAFGDVLRVSARGSAAAHDYVYYLGKNDFLRVLKLRVRQGGLPELQEVAGTSLTFGYTSGSPVVTSAGTSVVSAVVWVIRAADASGAEGRLIAFPAVPPAGCGGHCTLRPLWSAPLGRVSRFAIPATSGGRIYVGTRDGQLYGFGAAPAALRAHAPVSFGPARIGTTTRREITITAAARVRVTGVTASTGTAGGSFRVRSVATTWHGRGATTARFPAVLTAGDRLHVQVAFSPAAPGSAVGTLRLSAGPGRTLAQIPLSGDGIRAGLYATSRVVPFALTPSGQAPESVPAGMAVTEAVVIANGGSGVQTVTSVTPPGGPFTATGLPARGTRLQPGQSLAVPVTYAPRQAGRATGVLTVAGSSGTHATIQLTGTAVAARSGLKAVPAGVRFGAMRPGRRVTAVVAVRNAGNQAAALTGGAVSGAPFGVASRVPRGLPLDPQDDVRIAVTFSPRRRGRDTGVFRLAWTDRAGRHTLAVRLAGRGS